MARIIIVDDDEVVTDLLVELLDGCGHLASAVHRGEDGVAAIRDGAPDLVVLDYTLPDITGMEVLRRVRAADAATPVLMLTARGGRIHDGRARAEGADDYLVKPFDPPALVARIEALLARRAAA